VDAKPHSELRADIARERERRHWTIPQWREMYPEDWPSGMARVRKEADAAVDSLLEQLQTTERQRDGAELMLRDTREQLQTAQEQLARCVQEANQETYWNQTEYERKKNAELQEQYEVAKTEADEAEIALNRTTEMWKDSEARNRELWEQFEEVEEKVARALYEKAMEERRTCLPRFRQDKRWDDEPYVAPVQEGESRPTNWRDPWREQAHYFLSDSYPAKERQ
jgi:chromosome segregation ATPase